MKKLSLNKETIAILDNKAMNQVKGGGLGYKLSLGRKCKYSKSIGADTAEECEKYLTIETDTE